MNGVLTKNGGFSGVYMLFVTVVLPSALPGVVRADAFDDYQLVRTFALPAGAGPLDILPDGRIITLVNADVYTEVAVASGEFLLQGSLPSADLPFFGAAFIRMSPDGTTMAVGNNGGAEFGNFKVGIFDLASLTGDWFSANHFDGAWIDNTRIALTAGDFGIPSVVTVLDTTSPDPSNPTNTTVIDNIGGASGGIAFDTPGNLYTGNGFSFAGTNTAKALTSAARRPPPAKPASPAHRQRFFLRQLQRQGGGGFTSAGSSGTGAVKAFANAAWAAALTAGPPLDFENGGRLVVDILSASPLGFDSEGNLLVGGGDVAPDADFVALVRAMAITEALMEMGPADPNDPTEVRRLDPDTSSDFNFYSVVHNPTTGELYIKDFGASTVYVYRDLMGIPAVSEWGIGILSLLLLTAGTVMIRRRQLWIAGQAALTGGGASS